MIVLMMYSTLELMQEIAAKSQARRLALNLTQAGLCKRSGVSLAVIRQFEQSGRISLESLVKIALALGCEGGFLSLFQTREQEEEVSIDTLLKRSQKRKRGRVT